MVSRKNVFIIGGVASIGVIITIVVVISIKSRNKEQKNQLGNIIGDADVFKNELQEFIKTNPVCENLIKDYKEDLKTELENLGTDFNYKNFNHKFFEKKEEYMEKNIGVVVSFLKKFADKNPNLTTIKKLKNASDQIDTESAIKLCDEVTTSFLEEFAKNGLDLQDGTEEQKIFIEHGKEQLSRIVMHIPVSR